MDDSNYQYESSSEGGSNESFERRLKLQNAAARIALLNTKMSNGKQDDNSDSDNSDNSSRRNKNRRSK
jgi:hypothetical protein